MKTHKTADGIETEIGDGELLLISMGEQNREEGVAFYRASYRHGTAKGEEPLMFPDGGGFAVRMSAVKADHILARGAEAERVFRAMPTTAAKFEMDCCDPLNFSGYHVAAENWNGWATPSFSKEEANRFLEACAKSNIECGNEVEWGYEKDGDYFWFWDENNGDRQDPDTLEKWSGREVKTEDGVKHLYAVGSWGWCWTVKEEDENEVI
jgi:hypothetical protein